MYSLSPTTLLISGCHQGIDLVPARVLAVNATVCVPRSIMYLVVEKSKTTGVVHVAECMKPSV